MSVQWIEFCVVANGSNYPYNATVIADNIYSKCDDKGRRHAAAVLQEITNLKKRQNFSGYSRRIHTNKALEENSEDDN